MEPTVLDRLHAKPDEIISRTAKFRAKRDDGTIEFTASTEELASDGLVIRKEAWAPYLKGGDREKAAVPFLASHNAFPVGQEVPAIGSVVDRWWEEGEGLVIRVRFVGADVNEYGPKWEKAYRDGVLDSVSVSWRGSKFKAERGKPGDNEVVGFSKWREVSGVVDGADSGAKKRAAEYGLLFPEQAAAAVQAEPPAPATVSNVQPEPVVVRGKDELAKSDPPLPPEPAESEVEEEGAKKQEAAIKAQGHSAEALGAAAVAERAARAAGSRDAMARAYSQFLDSGALFSPHGQGTFSKSLPGQAYRLTWTLSGVGFIPTKPATDELYCFRGSQMEAVLREVDDFWGAAQDYEKLGLLHHRGILLEGPPGTGKTSLLAQAAEMAAGRGDVVLFSASASLLTAALHSFREVEPKRPVIVVMEDADAHVGGHSERDMLALLDGDRAVGGVLYLATTNYIGSFPERFLRPGRFDRIVHVGPPTIEGRTAYLTQKLAKVEKAGEIARLAGETDGFTFADLRELIVSVYALKEPAATVLDRLAKRVAARKSWRASGPAFAELRSAGRAEDAAVDEKILAACGEILASLGRIEAKLKSWEEEEGEMAAAPGPSRAVPNKVQSKEPAPGVPAPGDGNGADDAMSAALRDLEEAGNKAAASAKAARLGGRM